MNEKAKDAAEWVTQDLMCAANALRSARERLYDAGLPNLGTKLDAPVHMAYLLMARLADGRTE